MLGGGTARGGAVVTLGRGDCDWLVAAGASGGLGELVVVVTVVGAAGAVGVAEVTSTDGGTGSIVVSTIDAAAVVAVVAGPAIVVAGPAIVSATDDWSAGGVEVMTAGTGDGRTSPVSSTWAFTYAAVTLAETTTAIDSTVVARVLTHSTLGNLPASAGSRTSKKRPRLWPCMRGDTDRAVRPSRMHS